MNALRYTVVRIDLAKVEVEITTDASADAILAAPPRLSFLRQRLGPEVEILATGHAGTRYRIGPDWPGSDSWPQVNARFGPGWAVLPVWALIAGAPQDCPVHIRSEVADAEDVVPDCPCPCGDLAPFVILSGFKADTQETGPRILLSPEAESAGLGRLTRAATAALLARFGPLPCARALISLEPQAPDTGREKGYAHLAEGLLFARLLFRADADGHPVSPDDLCDLVVHELLHHYLRTEDVTGSWLVEGLVTYLARRILCDAGKISDAAWQAWRQRAKEDLARNPMLGNLSLASAPERFGEAHVPNLVYAKGFLVGEALDRQLDGRLAAISQDLVRNSPEGAITPAGFAAMLPASVRKTFYGWLAATGMPEEA